MPGTISITVVGKSEDELKESEAEAEELLNDALEANDDKLKGMYQFEIDERHPYDYDDSYENEIVHHFVVKSRARESCRPHGSRLFERGMLRENYVEVAEKITNAMEELYDKYDEKGAQASMDDETVRKQLEYSIYNLVSRFRGVNRDGRGDIFYNDNDGQDLQSEDAALIFEHAQKDMMKQNGGHIPPELWPAVNLQGFVYYLTKVLGKNENTKVRTIAKYFEVPENRSRLVSQINNVLYHKRDPMAYGYKAVD